MLGRITAILLALTILSSGNSLIAAEARSYQPPANTPVIPWTRFSIQYAVRVVGNARTAKVEFYLTDNGGKSWKKYGEDPDRISPMVITVPNEGTYGFITVVSTNVRPALAPRPGTRPDRFIIVDRTPPQAEWLSPKQDQILLTDSGITLTWKAIDPHLGLTPVSLEYSTDNGNFWLPLREKLPAKGSINWNPPVLEGETNISLRLIATDIAGNKRIVRNKTTFTVDNTPPVVTILGPSSSGSFKFDIDYSVEDVDSGVSKVELFYTVDGGDEWFYFGPDSDLRAPLQFSSPAAKEVGLYIVATDKSGNKTPTPARGARPMAFVTLDMEPPQVSILPPFTTSGEVIAKDQVVDIRWNSSDINIKENSTLIQFSRDGGATWSDLAFDKPSNGVWQWVPNVEGSNLLLKISVSDVMGNVGTAISMPFSIDTERPQLEFESVNPLQTENNSGSLTQSNVDSSNDIWAPPVPSTMELESETITDLPVQPISQDNSVSDSFEPFTEDSSIAEEATTEAIDVPGIGMSDVPVNTDDIIGDPTPASETLTNETDDFSIIDDIPDPTPLTEETVAEIPAPVADKATNNDLDLGNIPDIPGFDEVTETATETVIDTEVPDLGASTDSSIPAIPAPPVSDGEAEFDLDLSAIPDAGMPSETVNISEQASNEISIPEIPSIDTDTTLPTDQDAPLSDLPGTVEEAADTTSLPAIPDLPSPVAGEDSLGLPLDLDSEIPDSPAMSVEELLNQAQQAYEEAEDLDKAEQLAKQVLDIDPQNAQAYAIIASTLTEKGNFDNAFDYAHKAINLAPDNAEYLKILGYAQYQKAVEINKMLGDSDLSPSQAANLRSQLITSLDQAQSAYSKMISANDPTEVKEGYYRLAQVDYFRGTRIIEDEEQAAATLRRAIANYQKAYSIGEPDYREVLQIGICNYRLMDYDQAEQWLEKAQEITPVGRTPKEAFFYLALINEKTNRSEEALPFWEKVAEYYPEGSSYQKLAATRISAISGQ